MKKNNKRSWALMLALLLSISVILAACGSSNEGGPSSQPSARPGGSTGTSTPSTESKPKITVSIYDRNNVPEGEGTITDNRWTRWINENAPVEVEFIPIPRTNSSERWNVLFASNSAPDLIFEFSNAYMRDLATKGQILKLDDIITQYSTNYRELWEGNENIQRLTRYNGDTYFLGRLIPMTTNHYLMIRTDWLDNLGLSMPETTEEFLEVAKAFTEQDPDRNNQHDTLGTTFHDVDYFFQLSQVNNETIPISAYFLDNDQYVRDWERPRAALAYKKSLYEAGVVDRDLFADSTNQKAQQDWVNGKLGIWSGTGLETAGALGLFETLRNNNPDAEVAILPLPRSEFGQFSPAGADYMQFTAAINATAKNPEAVMQYVDWLMTDEVQQTLIFGFEGEHYTRDSDGLPKVIDAQKNQKELTWNVDFYMLAQTGLMGRSVEFYNQLDLSDPLHIEYTDLIDQGRAAYVTPERPKTNEVVLPVSLPDDLVIIENTVKNTITSIYTRAVVESNYSVDQAISDAKDAWERAGGQRIDDFYAQAYIDHKEDVIFTKDFYKYMDQ